MKHVNRRFAEELDVTCTRGERVGLAALLLPRFKKRWFRCISEDEQRHLIERLKEFVAPEGLSDELRRLKPAESEPSKSTDEYYNFGESSMGGEASDDDSDPLVEAIIYNYFNDAKTEPSMLRKHSALEPIFRRYNTTPPSSAQVERMFSLATIVNAPRCNRLSDEKFEERVVSRANAAQLPASLPNAAVHSSEER